MSGTDPSALSQIWQDPGTALQILGTLAPNVVYHGYPLHIREGMQQLGTQVGNVQQRAYLEQAMDKARGQLYPTSNIPVDQAAQDIEGAVAGNGILPQRPEMPSLFSRARGLELARPMPLGQFLGTLTPQQRRAMMAGSTAPRAGEGPIASGMDIYATQRQEALGELDATKARLWRQAGDIALKGDPTSDDPNIQDAWGAIHHLALNDPTGEGLNYLKDERSRVSQSALLTRLGMDPKLARLATYTSGTTQQEAFKYYFDRQNGLRDQKAYLDQMEQSGALAPADMAALRSLHESKVLFGAEGKFVQASQLRNINTLFQAFPEAQDTWNRQESIVRQLGDGYLQMMIGQFPYLRDFITSTEQGQAKYRDERSDKERNIANEAERTMTDRDRLQWQKYAEEKRVQMQVVLDSGNRVTEALTQLTNARMQAPQNAELHKELQGIVDERRRQWDAASKQFFSTYEPQIFHDSQLGGMVSKGNALLQIDPNQAALWAKAQRELIDSWPSQTPEQKATQVEARTWLQGFVNRLAQSTNPPAAQTAQPEKPSKPGYAPPPAPPTPTAPTGPRYADGQTRQEKQAQLKQGAEKQATQAQIEGFRKQATGELQGANLPASPQQVDRYVALRQQGVSNADAVRQIRVEGGPPAIGGLKPTLPAAPAPVAEPSKAVKGQLGTQGLTRPPGATQTKPEAQGFEDWVRSRGRDPQSMNPQELDGWRQYYDRAIRSGTVPKGASPAAGPQPVPTAMAPPAAAATIPAPAAISRPPVVIPPPRTQPKAPQYRPPGYSYPGMGNRPNIPGTFTEPMVVKTKEGKMFVIPPDRQNEILSTDQVLGTYREYQSGQLKLAK